MKTTSHIEPADGSTFYFLPDGATDWVELGKVEGPVQITRVVEDNDPRAGVHEICE